MSEVNKFEVQQMYDAAKDITRAQDPMNAYDANSGGFVFKNEYERKMFLVGLDPKKLDAAIKVLGSEKNEVGLSDAEKKEYLMVLKRLQTGIDDNKRRVRAALHNEPWVIDAAIPGPKWEKDNKSVTVEGKSYGIEKREGSEKEKSDLKIDTGIMSSVVIKDVPNSQIDKVLDAYATANAKNAKDSPLKSGMLGKTVKYDEIKDLINAPAVASAAPAVASAAPAVASALEKTRTADQKNKINKEFLENNKDTWSELVNSFGKKGLLELHGYMSNVTKAEKSEVSQISVESLQSYINNQYLKDSTDEKLIVDGELGKKTLSALQTINKTRQ